MNLELIGKRALVTGSSSGVGATIAATLAREGATVVVHGRDPARTDSVAASIREGGGRAEAIIGDLAVDEGASAVVGAALAQGPVDILVNNAGYYDFRTWDEASMADWMHSYQVNVLSAVRMIQAFVPFMRDRGWGRVIQIGGASALQPRAQQPHYNCAMAARHNLAVSLARRLAGSGITSNAVAPGPIRTAAMEQMFTRVGAAQGWGSTWADIEAGVLQDFVKNDVSRLGTADDVATAVAYLASPLAGYISGAVIHVDGGMIRTVQ